jgi:hypothetical protein
MPDGAARHAEGVAAEERRLSEDSVVIQSVERRYVIRGESRGQAFAWDVSEEAFNRLRLQMDEAERCEACRAFDEAAVEYHEREKAEAEAEIAALEREFLHASQKPGTSCRPAADARCSTCDEVYHVAERIDGVTLRSRCSCWDTRREQLQEQQVGGSRWPEHFSGAPSPPQPGPDGKIHLFPTQEQQVGGGLCLDLERAREWYARTLPGYEPKPHDLENLARREGFVKREGV